MIGKFSNKEDIMILKQLYYGNHLSDIELKRASKLLYLLNIDLKNRCK